jgi:hypothetical protein
VLCHVGAAGHLRLLVDDARLSLSGSRDLSVPIQAILYRWP